MLREELDRLYTDYEEEDLKKIQLSKCISYGDLVMKGIIRDNDKFANTEVIVLSLYRNVLELLDGLYLLVDHNSKSSSIVVLRSLFEASANFSYLLIDHAKIEERANFYYVGFAMEEIKACKKTLSLDRKGILSAEKLQKKIDDHNKNLNGYQQKNYNEWKRQKNKLVKIRNNSDVHSNWYSVFNGPRSLKQLSERVNLKDVYDLIYSNFSLEAHGFVSLDGIRLIEDGGVQFQPLRSIDTLQMPIYLGTRLFSMCTAYLLKTYLKDQLEDFNIFFDEITKYFD
ncbi:DUF5677 domain-containing protein [Paenibacillus lentus]|uniref:Uncharacterized protein n=1 Tax=Paenibacillus lentus TaxID=1338368 RepID=A0A3S8RWR4_9BACL|nr:DUF5677 domain-containing protein [Paenibacillus lentus]AZK47230.1 hypothetical protein EIM92_14570 [Paenibacillus lentus]